MTALPADRSDSDTHPPYVTDDRTSETAGADMCDTADMGGWTVDQVTAWALTEAQRKLAATKARSGRVLTIPRHLQLTDGERVARFVDELIRERGSIHGDVCFICHSGIGPDDAMMVTARTLRLGTAHWRCMSDTPAEELPVLMLTNSCAWCDRIIVPEHRAGYQVAYCCDEHRRLWRNAVRLTDPHTPRTCTECNARFTPPRSDAQTCSPRCRQRRHRRLKTSRRPEGPPGEPKNGETNE